MRSNWLTVVRETQAYGVDDTPIFRAQPGEQYRLVELQESWGLVQRLGDPPSQQVWLALDDRVQLSTPFPP